LPILNVKISGNKSSTLTKKVSELLLELTTSYIHIEDARAASLHDLRRTFITIAESLDISAYAVKRLVNHKMNNDVTAGYIIADVERLRKPMQCITNCFLNLICNKG
jgi:hypothetical protein